MGVNFVTDEELEALFRGENPLAESGFPKPNVGFRCDTCAAGTDRRSFRQSTLTMAVAFAIPSGLQVLEGRCERHLRFIPKERQIPYELGSEFLFHKFCLADVLGS